MLPSHRAGFAWIAGARLCYIAAMDENYTTVSESETAALAEKLSPMFAVGDIVCLRGPLGAGKSVFARALIRSICADPDLNVPSPTFTLLQTYDSAAGPVHHYDLYRLEEADEIYELGWEESCSDAITIVEWPERIAPLLPARYYEIAFKPDANDTRHIIVSRR